MADKTLPSVAQSVPLAPRLIGIGEVATYVGLSIHTLYRMVSERRIPHVKLGRALKFDLKDVDTWISKNTVRPRRTLDSVA
jgi:excisionase family DNA binding protein